MSTKVPTPSKIVQNPRLWPTSFAKPVTSQQTFIRNYIFKDGTKVEKFLDFVNKTFPNRKVDIKQQNDGSTSVSLTTTSLLQVNSNDETFCRTDCKQDSEDNGWSIKQYQSCLNRCNCRNKCKTRYGYINTECVMECTFEYQDY